MSHDSTNPYLSGNYAPVQEELDVNALEVVGEIPKDLLGIYMRNGPNPAFPPISYTYPYDGDGMIHALYIANGKAAYRNRFVATKGLLKERTAGKALYSGVLKPAPMDPQWATPEDEPIAIKNGAFIHIMRHHNTYLALSEGFPAYRMTSSLETLGEWKPCNNQAIEVCAHTRLDPLTGELWFVNYSLTPPYLTFYQFDRHGKMLQKLDIEKPYCSMVHDFILTKNYVIVFDCPVVFDLQQIMKGGPVLSWQPHFGVRIGVMSRANGQMKWLHTEPFFVFHFANAYEQNNEIIIDYVRHEKVVLLTEENQDKSTPPRLNRTILNLEKGTMKHSILDDRIMEFPRIKEDRDTLPHQFVYTLTKTLDGDNPRAFNALIKYDVSHQLSHVYDFGPHAEIGEAVFAPSTMQESEDDGYLMLFVYDNTTNQSEFVILDAQNVQDKPLARIKMPQRIPNGLHGSWMPGAWN